jgi:hypothetical protein
MIAAILDDVGESRIAILWEHENGRCVLYRVDGCLEIRREERGRTVQLETCATESDAREKAARWLEGARVSFR